MTPVPLQKFGSKNLPNANKVHAQTLNTHHSETRGRATHTTRGLCAAHRCVRYLHAPTPDPNPGNSRRTRGWNCDSTSVEAAGTLGPCGAGRTHGMDTGPTLGHMGARVGPDFPIPLCTVCLPHLLWETLVEWQGPVREKPPEWFSQSRRP